MAVTIGAITIGQSPRIDVVPDMIPLLGGVILEQRGALDGLSFTEIESLQPVVGDAVLVTRLQDGRFVHCAEHHILARMQLQIDQLINQGAAGIALLCTGEFPDFSCHKPILYPQRLLWHFVAGASLQQTVGVIIPVAGQVEQARKRWMRHTGRRVVVAFANPYQDQDNVVNAGILLKQQGAELIVMDCIGYTCQMKNVLVKNTGLPVILPRTIVARTIAELFSV